ncbi:MAG: quinone-dependent dihydroorotate dehydrogenase [Alphaproteobacteria bacterium]|nr:quinone-dependent dihydroorotate dehydrogenase [Alphaproteobacteria bacterium]MBL7097300.1 quinone-dependent dihydroorotate dehydrogenase [Alphaproteobacteria bacterium]
MILDSATALLRLLPAETAHKATIFLTRIFGGLAPAALPPDPRLAVRVLGKTFSNPIGLAAGFDKNAVVPNQMLRFGFGFVECGTVTPRPQKGNPRPRLFRLEEDRAVINRMGFNNDGMAEAAVRLARRPRRGIVGINIGANKDSTDRIADYKTAFGILAPYADYVTVNVSSPNTPGLRGLQGRDELTRLLAVLTARRAEVAPTMPLLLKIAPDLDMQALDDIAAVVTASAIEGLIVSNTTVARPSALKSPLAKEAGGLSGTPLFEPSTHILREVKKRVSPALTLIGVGGISSGAHAYAKLRAGASLVQLYTALAYEGPGLVVRLQRELLQCLERDGFRTIAEAIGAG